MAKVKITGHASGTGILTVTAPNTSSDRTITLPDATGTLLNSDGDGSSLSGVLPLAGGTMTGNIVGGDTTVSAVNLKDFGIVNNAIGSIGGGTQDIDLTLGNSVSGTVDTSTTTFTFSNPTASDELCIFSLVLTNGGSQTVNFPASVDWEGGTAPTLTTAGVDILVFATVDGGTIWHGQSYSLDSKTPS
ncbi:MAG: hypothetical protein QF535_21070 [Anaerolineales bacterium]|nr:hypothetical protein [Anaerolineales bacterium]